MENSDYIFEKIIPHLDYFGYASEVLEEGKVIKAIHQGYGNVFIRAMGQVLLHTNYWLISESATNDDLDLLKIINRLNQSNYVSTYSIMEDGGLRIDAVFAGEYSKQSYGEFIDDFHQDIVRALRNDDELNDYREQKRLALVN